MVPVEINGKSTEFVFDSGAAITVISQKYADYFRITADFTRSAKLFVAHDKPVYAPLGAIGEIRVGGMVRKNLRVHIITFPPESTIRGLIGMNFLKGLRFTVEMDTGVLILREPKKN
jgi:predicted aspartyl protease